MINLMIADDHAIVRHGLKQLLALVPDIHISGEAGSGGELQEIIAQTPCDLVLLDMNMPGLSGVDMIKWLHDGYPEVPILVLSMHVEGPIARRALKAGARGYLTKDSEPEIIVEAIRKLSAGGKFIDAALVETLVFDQDKKDSAPHEVLSEREMQVFLMLASGRTISEIAEELCLSIKTVSTHKARLMQKLNLHSVADLVKYAVEHKLI